MSKPCIYFDNNATTLICKSAKDACVKYLSCYNPSGDSKLSKSVKRMMDQAVDYILAHCGVNKTTHTVIFTSGGSESNCFVIRAATKAYHKQTGNKPHVILSATEHHSSIECVKDLEIEATYVKPQSDGSILARDVEAVIQPNTCLITIMRANNEIPVINPIGAIGKVAHHHRIPFHSDCVQTFGKFQLNMQHNVDAISGSSHKFYGPKGVGLLVISKKFIEDSHLTAEISGSQQSGLRGGTENVPGIAATLAALKYAFTRRPQKNTHLWKLRERTLAKLGELFPFARYETYLTEQSHPALELVSIGPTNKFEALPNTILLAICKNQGEPFCNVKLKKCLEKHGVVVSIGSACMTKSDSASHVLTAIDAPKVIKRGVIRISFGDCSTQKEVDEFIRVLHGAINNQCKDIIHN